MSFHKVEMKVKVVDVYGESVALRAYTRKHNEGEPPSQWEEVNSNITTEQPMILTAGMDFNFSWPVGISD